MLAAHTLILQWAHSYLSSSTCSFAAWFGSCGLVFTIFPAHERMLDLKGLWVHLILLQGFSVCFLLPTASASEIPLGSKLSVGDSSFWLSDNANFALGFYSPPDQTNLFSVGIRFNAIGIPTGKQTMVWVAGADVRVSNNSYFQLAGTGELILFDSSKGQVLWSSETGHLSVASAHLHENGNLVLLNQKRDIVWQSFDTPSDTLLPGQKLSAFKTLRAASQNYVASHYSLFMNVSGELQLRWGSSTVFWSSGSLSSSNLTATLTSNGALQLVDKNMKTVWSMFAEDHSDAVDFRFLRLDVDGNLRTYSWNESSKSWRSVWQAVENQCKVFATCDQKGTCSFDGSGSAVCECRFTSAVNSNSKCLVSSGHDCKSGSVMVEYPDMVLYEVYPANDSVVKTNLHRCRSMCLEDPSCTAATFRNDGTADCQLMKTPYVTGYCFPSLGSISFVRQCLNPLAADPSFRANSTHGEPQRLCVPCLIGAAAATAVILTVIQFGIGFCTYRKKSSYRTLADLVKEGMGSKCLIMLSFGEIKEITGNFNHQIGPKMFKGTLSDDQAVAVKELESSIDARKFRAAALKMGNIHHKCLTKLEGYCCELGHKYLVYEYATNGSLDKYMEDPTLNKRLTWRKRISICLSVGKAILYLHVECREFMSHGNLTCENVVLDKDLDAKVSEYGLRVLEPEANSELASSAEKDVKDFGRLVLTLVTGCLDIDQEVCEWAYGEWREGSSRTISDRRVEDVVDVEELERVLRIAFWCLQGDERMRPSMAEVVKMLEGTLSVDPPPPAFACHSPPLKEEESSGSSREL